MGSRDRKLAKERAAILADGVGRAFLRVEHSLEVRLTRALRESDLETAQAASEALQAHVNVPTGVLWALHLACKRAVPTPEQAAVVAEVEARKARLGAARAARRAVYGLRDRTASTALATRQGPVPASEARATLARASEAVERTGLPAREARYRAGK